MLKQVIVIRKDLKMRRGKEIAQGSHASIAFLTRRMRNPFWRIYYCMLKPQEMLWMRKSFAKICLKVNSEEELLKIYELAKKEKLEVHLIQDNGKTEFNGKKTYTCLAIGPDYNDKIDKVTKHLSLY